MNVFSLKLTLIILALALSLIAFPGIGSLPRFSSVRGASTIPPLNPSGWVPAGPMADRIQFKFYTDSTSELTALAASQIDLTDTPVLSNTCPPTTCTGTTFTPPTAAFYSYDIDFNHANTFFGIPFNFGMDGTPSTAAAINFRQGVAQLIDKVALVNNLLGGKSFPIDNALPPSQGVTHSGLPYDGTTTGTASYNYNYTSGGATGSYHIGGVCSWDKLHGPGCLSALHYASDLTDSSGVVQVGTIDFCDAADHWIAAGLASGKSSTDCHLTGLSQALIGGSINFMVRIDGGYVRYQLGLALAARMCQLINGPSVTSCSQIVVNQILFTGAVNLVFPTCSSSGCLSPNLAWHMYTGSFFASENPEQEYSIYNGQFAGGPWCPGAVKTNTGQNYIHFCNARHDHYTSMLEFNDTQSGGLASLQVAMDLMGNHTGIIPLWPVAYQWAYLNGWNNVIDKLGAGIPNTYSLLNMWNPNPAIPGTVRWGGIAGTFSLNPFLANTPTEVNVLSEIYDTLLTSNPFSPLDTFGWMTPSWNVLPARSGDPAGTVEDIQFHLRDDLFFHDGVRVTSSDVKFSLLGFKTNNIPFGLGLSPPLPSLIDVQIVSDSSFIVNVNSRGPFLPKIIGGVHVVPQHLWAADTSTRCVTAGTKQCTINPSFLKPTFDPTTNHILIGSGPFQCVDPTTGQVGGGCTSTGTQGVLAGGSITLERFGLGFNGLDASHSYFRDSAKYKQWQWADVFNHQVVDIIDASAVAACLDKPANTSPICTHFDSPASTLSCVATAGSCHLPMSIGGNLDGTVDLLEVSQVFSWYQNTWTSPLIYGQLIGAQPIPQTLYEGGLVLSP